MGNLQNSYSTVFFSFTVPFLKAFIIMKPNLACIASDFGNWPIHVKEMPLQCRKVPVFLCFLLPVLRNWPYLQCYWAWKDHVCLFPVKTIVGHYCLDRHRVDTATDPTVLAPVQVNRAGQQSLFLLWEMTPWLPQITRLFMPWSRGVWPNDSEMSRITQKLLICPLVWTRWWINADTVLTCLL